MIGKMLDTISRLIAVAVLTALPVAAIFPADFGGKLIALLVTLLFVVAGLVLAAPAMLLLRWRGRNSTPNYLLIGLIVGVILGAFLTGYGPDSETGPDAPAALRPARGMIGAAFGGAYGLWASTIWCVAFRRRRSGAATVPRAGKIVPIDL